MDLFSSCTISHSCFLSPPDPHLWSTQIDSLYVALQMALVKLQLRNSGHSVSHERLLQAFTFIDTNANGSLDHKELLDAFNGMGIFVTPEVWGGVKKCGDVRRGMVTGEVCGFVGMGLYAMPEVGEGGGRCGDGHLCHARDVGTFLAVKYCRIQVRRCLLAC